jgi:hypothetical protein
LEYAAENNQKINKKNKEGIIFFYFVVLQIRNLGQKHDQDIDKKDAKFHKESRATVIIIIGINVKNEIEEAIENQHDAIEQTRDYQQLHMLGNFPMPQQAESVSGHRHKEKAQGIDNPTEDDYRRVISRLKDQSNSIQHHIGEDQRSSQNIIGALVSN